MEMIKVIIKEVDQEPEIKEIDNNYKVLQEYVGGTIDITNLPNIEPEVDIICNDEFLLNGSMANFMMPERDHVMGGCCVFAGYDPETGNTISLTDKQIKKTLEYLDRNKVKNMDIGTAFYLMNGMKVGFKGSEAEL